MRRSWGCGRATLWLALAVLVAACSHGTILAPHLQESARQAFLRQEAEVFHLSTNNLTVLLIPDHNTNLIKVDVRYAAGAMDDPADKPGLAHVVEHVSFTIRPNNISIAQRISKAAFHYNAFTTHEETEYTAVALSDHLTELLAAESLRMHSECAEIDDAEIELAREVVRNELRQGTSAYRAMVQEFRNAVYGADHPYSREVGGSDESLARISRDDICGFIAANYHPRNAILVISGNVDAAAVKREVATMFGSLPPGPERNRPVVAHATLRGTRSSHKLPVDQATAVIAFDTPRVLDRDATIARLASSMLNSTLAGLAREQPYIDDIDVDRAGGPSAPIMYIAITVNDPSKLEDAVRLVFEETAKVGKDIDSAALNSTRNRFHTEILSSMESFMSQSEQFIEYLYAGDDHRFLLHDLDVIAELTASDLRNYARAYLGRDRSHVAYFLPSEKAAIDEQRAASHFNPDSHPSRGWQSVVDRSEAERPLAVPATRIRAKFREIALDNGMKVFLAPDLSYPVVDIRVVFPVGTDHDPAGKQGLAYFAALLLRPQLDIADFEDLTFAGVQNIVDILQMGGDYDWEVDDLSTSFRMRGLSIYADGLLWQLYFMLSSARYESASLKRMREIFDANDRDSADRPSWPERVMTALFGKGASHQLSRSSRASRARISKGDLEDLRDSYYQPDGAAIIMTGQFDPDYVTSEIKRLFGPWRGKAGPRPRPLPDVVERRSAAYLATVDAEAIQTEIIMAFATRSSTPEQLFARMVLDAILEDKLQVVRTRLGSSYGASVDHTALRGAGVLVIRAAVDRERAGETFLAMRQALDEVRKGDIVDEFVRARRLVVQQALAASIDSRSVADQLELLAVYDYDYDDRDKVVGSLAKVTLDQVRELVADELAATREVVVVEGRKASIASAYQAAGIRRYQLLE